MGPSPEEPREEEAGSPRGSQGGGGRLGGQHAALGRAGGGPGGPREGGLGPWPSTSSHPAAPPGRGAQSRTGVAPGSSRSPLPAEQVNNATARVMTNKKTANPYTNGKGPGPGRLGPAGRDAGPGG